MSKRAVRAIGVNIYANIKNFQKNLKKINKDIRKMAFDVKKAGSFMNNNFTKPILAAGTALAAVSVKAIRFGSDLYDMSQKTGISVEKLQEFEYIASQLGTNLSTLSTANTQLLKSMREAQKEASVQSKIFKELRIETINLDGSFRSTEEVFLDTRKALSSIEDQTLRTMLAERLFKGSHQDLIRVLSEDEQSIQNMRNRFKELGLEVSELNVKALNDLGDRFAEIRLQIKTASTMIAVALLPLLNSIADTIQTKVIPTLAYFSHQLSNLSPEQIQQIAITAAKIAAIGPGLLIVSSLLFKISSGLTLLIKGAGVFGKIAGLVKTLTSSFGSLASIKTSLGGIIAKVGAVFIKIFTVANIKIVAVVLAVMALIDGVRAAMEANEGLKEAILSTLETFKTMFISIYKFLSELFVFLWKFLRGVLRVLTGIVSRILTHFSGTFKSIFGIIKSTFGAIENILKVLTSIFKGEWGNALRYLQNAVISTLQIITNAIEAIINFFPKLFGSDWQTSFATDALEKLKAEIKDTKEEGEEAKSMIDRFSLSLNSFGTEADKTALSVSNLANAMRGPFGLIRPGARFLENLKAKKESGFDVKALQNIFSETEGGADSVSNFNDKVVQLIGSIREMANGFSDFGNAFKRNVIQVLSPARMRSNLEQSLRQFQNWQQSIEQLSLKGVSEQLIQQIRGMGVEGLSISGALLTMSSAERKDIERMLMEREAIATTQATTQVMARDIQEQKRDIVININGDITSEEDARKMAEKMVRELQRRNINPR